MDEGFTFNKRLTRFYEKYAPDKLGDISYIARKYATQEKKLFRELTFKYGQA